MAIDLEREPPFRVGGATIDPVSRDSKYADGQERLQPQTLKVLVALTRRRNQVVTRSELVDDCWDGKIIGDDVINRCISMLRHFAERAGIVEGDVEARERTYCGCDQGLRESFILDVAGDGHGLAAQRAVDVDASVGDDLGAEVHRGHHDQVAAAGLHLLARAQRLVDDQRNAPNPSKPRQMLGDAADLR